MTGVRELIADLEVASDEAVGAVERVVGAGCRNIQVGVRRRWAGHPHIPHLGRAVDYDVTREGDTVSGEVGPNRAKRQGGLGSYIELGTVHSGPIPALSPELDIEAPKFERALGDLAADLLEGARIRG